MVLRTDWLAAAREEMTNAFMAKTEYAKQNGDITLVQPEWVRLECTPLGLSSFRDRVSVVVLEVDLSLDGASIL